MFRVRSSRFAHPAVAVDPQAPVFSIPFGSGPAPAFLAPWDSSSGLSSALGSWLVHSFLWLPPPVLCGALVGVQCGLNGSRPEFVEWALS